MEVVYELAEPFPLPPATLSTPPTAPPGGAVDCVAFEASWMKASRVLPVVGALMDPTMPFWQ